VFFPESRHFGIRNDHGFKQESRCVKLECLASVTDICSFLGLVGYYKRFVEGFSKISKPMTKFLGKDKKFNWTPAHEVWN
jgi:hypothetical protein